MSDSRRGHLILCLIKESWEILIFPSRKSNLVNYYFYLKLIFGFILQWQWGKLYSFQGRKTTISSSLVLKGYHWELNMPLVKRGVPWNRNFRLYEYKDLKSEFCFLHCRMYKKDRINYAQTLIKCQYLWITLYSWI